MMTTTNTAIANTIIQQIGNGALCMLGAKDIIAIDNGVQFKIRGCRKANCIKVTLTETDEYRLTVSKFVPMRFNTKRGTFSDPKNTIIADINGLHFDQLADVIAGVTGLAVRL